MKATLKGGRVIDGKIADLFVKIGIAKPEGEAWLVVKVTKKPAKVAKKAKEPVVLLSVDKTDYGKTEKKPKISAAPKGRTILGEIKEQKVKK